MKTTYLVSLAFLAIASAVPASVQRWDPYDDDGGLNSCAQQCKGQPNKFFYKTGTTYIYDYAVDTETSMAGASEDTAKLSIQALAEIQVIDRCEFALLIKDVKVSHTDGYSERLRTADREDEVRRVLEGSNLRFSFDDGVISSVCPERAETTWALNFKRGLLSAFQNSMENLDKNQKVPEVSVSGECEAEFNVTKSSYWSKEIKVTKVKNLLACSKHDGYKSMFQVTPYSINSEIQSMPILKGTHRCEYIIDSNKVLQSTSCEETHVYVPFANNESGGKTRVQQKLTLKSQKDGVDAMKGPVKERLGLLFEHGNKLDQLQNGPESLEQKLKEICDQTQDDIRPETPRLYSELVQIIKTLSEADVERAYKVVRDRVICPKNARTLKFFMDALPMAGTEGAVGVMTTLINNKQVEGLMADAWMSTLAFVQKPTRSMIEDGLKLLQGPSSIGALLPVSSLVHRYCKTVDSCENDYSIGQILSALRSMIPEYCSTDAKNMKDILKTLKAIGNTGQSSLTSSLDKCLSSDSAPLEVKVAAADAYRRMPCDSSFDQGDSSLWTALQDSSQESELRITSYLAIMRCPSDDTLSQISQLLEKEEDDHLGAFIYSHLNNLKETSDPLKQGVAKAISLHNFKEFTVNPLKFSSNHEASILINRLNLGFTADTNIIMSPKTPFPRSAMLNLTVDLFGSSINLLEIGGRVEGLEVLLEKLLGPNGYFPGKAEKKGDDKLTDVKGSYYARVFGNELAYGQVNGVEGKLPNFLDMLISLANRQDVTYTYSSQLMDVALIVPTVAGLPLEITVNGSVNLDLKAQGKVDLRRVATSPRSMEIDGEFRPSAALEVTGTMAVNALVTRMGLRMRNTMHSSTWLKGRIEINRGHVLNAEILPPGDKMEIFNARSQFFIIHNDIEKEQIMVKNNYREYKACSGDKLATVLGVELCAELKFPNASSRANAPYFPLTGPTSVSVMTYRRDTHTSYKLFAKRSESKQSSAAQFLIDTPNSRVNRMISTDITIVYTPDKQIDIMVNSPWKKLSLNSALVANKDIMSFVGSVLIDDNDKYGLTTEVKISTNGNNVAYSPFIELTQSGRTDTLLSGLVSVDLPSKFDANLEMKAIGGLPYTVQGGFVNSEKEKRIHASVGSQGKDMYAFSVGSTIYRTGKDSRNIKIKEAVVVKAHDKTFFSISGSNDYIADKSAVGDLTVEVYKQKPASLTWKLVKSKNYDADIKMKSSFLTGSIEANIAQQEGQQKGQQKGQPRNAITSKLKLTYNVPKFGTDVVMWTTKIYDKSKPTYLKYIITSNLDMNKYTDYNAGITLNIDHKKKHTAVISKLKYGPNPNNKKKVINLMTSLTNEIRSWKNADAEFKFNLEAPEKNVDVNLEMTHSHSTSPAKLDCSVNFKLNPFIKNELNAGISFLDKSSKMMVYTGQANLEIMGKKYSANSDLTQKSARFFQHTLQAQGPSGGKHSINTVYRKPSANRHEVTSDISLDGYKPIQVQGETLLDLSNFQISGNTVYDKDVYNVSAQSKLTNTMKKWNFDLFYPGRHIESEADVKNTKDKVSGSIMLDWDATKSTKSKISIDGSFRNSGNWDSGVVSGTISVKTPYEILDDLTADASYNSDSSQYSTKGKVSWGSRRETISSNLVVKRPLSPQNAQITYVATTPFRQFREIELEIDHKLEPSIASALKGRLEDNKAELKVRGENRSTKNNRDFYSSVEITTPFPAFRDAVISLEHQDDGRVFKTVGSCQHNSRKFTADLQMDHTVDRISTNNNGKLALTWPEDSLLTTWQHSLGTRDIKCSVQSTWSSNKNLNFNLVGSNYVENESRRVLGTVNVQTPWKISREISVQFDSTLGKGRLQSTASVLNNRAEKAAYDILLERMPQAGNVIFMLKSPLYDQKIRGQSKVIWESYPSTVSAWLEWAPWARIDFDGSLIAAAIDDISINTKLTTPFRNFENVIASLSHKLENYEYISQATVNYGVRKMIDFENRLRYDDNVKLFRTKLRSPCPYINLLNTGLRLNTSPDKFEGNADFELQPYVNKHDGFVFWNYDLKDFSAKLRLNTPHRQLPYLQITSWSKKNEGSLRASHIDVEPSPYGVYSFDTSYTNDLPLQLDVNLKTPHSLYDSVGLTASYSPSTTALQSRLRVKYQAGKEVDSQLNLNWRNNYEGSITVTTPFKGFENNKVLARHDMNSKGFTCHGEASVAGKYSSCDVVYTSSRSTTSGSISIVSPVPGYEKLSGKFNIKGALNNMQGDAALNIGTDAFSTKFSNSMSPGYLRSNLELQNPYSEGMKLSLQHSDTSSSSEIQIVDSFNGQYGDKSVDGKMSLSYAGMEKAKIDASLNTPFKNAQLSLEHELTPDSVSGKASILTDIEPVGNVEISISKNGPLENMAGAFSMIRNGESVIDTSVETNSPGNDVHGKISTRGRWLPTLTAEVDHQGTISDFNTKARLSSDGGNVFENEVTFKIEDTQVDVTGHLNYRYDATDHSHIISIHKEGTLTDFKVDLSKKCNGQEVTANVVFKADNEIKGLVQINNLSSKYDRIGVEFEHTGDTDKFLCTGKIMLSSAETVSGKVNFYRYNLQRIEATAELSTPWQEYRYSRFEYRHEGGDNRINCNINLQYGNGRKFSMDLITQCLPPSHSLSLTLKTPYIGYEEILLSTSFDDSKTDGRAVLGKGNEFTLTGVHDFSVSPYNIQYQITTPGKILEKATLSLRGSLLDGTVNLVLNSNNKKIEGSGALRYASPYSFSLTTQISSDIQGFRRLQLNVKNDDDSDRGKTSHFELSWDPQKQVVVDSRFLVGNSHWSSKEEYVFELDVKSPFEIVRAVKVDIGHNVETNSMKSVLSFEVNSQKYIDLDLNYDKGVKTEYSAVIRKPWPMEGSAIYQFDDYIKEGDVYANWNRDDFSSNLRVKGSMRYHPSNDDRSLTMAIVTPSRTVGVEHSLSTSTDKYSSSGKLYWAQDDDSKVSYSVDISNNNRRRDTIFYSGNFKLGLPSRTLGVSGSMNSNQLQRTADASLSWDLGRDDTKRIEVQVSLSGQEYTKADIFLKLPAQDLQVNSALILNQGNVIIDGKTDISYSSESRKTLTLFSKVKNTPTSYSYFSGSGSGFNYSVELGLRHPETKVDVKIDSHVATSDEFVTSSLGIQYMTTRRQMKNLALFAEIDKIRKQISFTASGPSSSAGVSSKIVRDEPLSLIVLGSVDGQEKFKSTFDVNKGTKALKFEIGQPDNLLSFSTYYPNSTALQADILHGKNQEATLGLRLVNSQLLKSRIQWRPAALDDLENFVTRQVFTSSQNVQQTLHRVNQDIRTELTAKYEEVTASVAEDIKPLLKFIETELESFAEDLDDAMLRLSDMHKNNEFYFQDIGSAVNTHLTYVVLAYSSVEHKLQEVVDVYRDAIRNTVQAIFDKLDQIRQFSFLDTYNQIVTSVLQNVMQTLDRTVVSFINLLREADLGVLERIRAILPDVRGIYSHPRFEIIRKRIENLKDYADRLNDIVRNIDPKPYTDILYSVKDRIIPERVRDMAERATNELYQQANLAYTYWHVEGNLQRHLKTSAELLKDVVEDELREYIDLLASWSPFTIFYPRSGYIEASILLPFEIKCLDELPNLTPYVNKAVDLYDKYAPDMDTIYQYAPSTWFSNQTEDSADDVIIDDIVTSLSEFEPSKSLDDRYIFRQ